MDVAEENRLPLLVLVESGGADLPRQADVFVPGGEQFRRLTQLSAQGIPTICVVFGSSTAGGAYLPGMSDYTVMVEDRARVFLGGPAAGEDGDRRGRRRGGARRRADARPHLGAVRLPGPGRARRPAHRPRHRGPPALAPARARPGGPGRTSRCTRPRSCSASRRSTCGCPSTCARSWPASSTAPASRSSRPPTAPSWSAAGRRSAATPSAWWPTTASCSREEAQKGAQFIELCNRSDTPILFVQNITGFMVGTRYEQGGIIKDGAKLINAVSNSTVPAPHPHGRRQLRGRATTPWRGGPTIPASSSPGPITASPSWGPSSWPACSPSCAATPPRPPAGPSTRRRTRSCARPPSSRSKRSRPRCSPPGASGTTASSTRVTRAPCWPSR